MYPLLIPLIGPQTKLREHSLCTLGPKNTDLQRIHVEPAMRAIRLMIHNRTRFQFSLHSTYAVPPPSRSLTPSLPNSFQPPPMLSAP